MTRTTAEIEAAADGITAAFTDAAGHAIEIDRHDRDALLVAAQSALAAADAVAWQPIETAPKDRWLLLAPPLGPTQSGSAVGVWSNAHECWYDVTIGHVNGLWKPTHWRYLPEPSR